MELLKEPPGEEPYDDATMRANLGVNQLTTRPYASQKKGRLFTQAVMM